MIKRNITETTCEYDKEGKLLKKTVVETHEEEDNTVFTTWPNTVPYYTLANGTSDSISTTATCSCDDCDCAK